MDVSTSEHRGVTQSSGHLKTPVVPLVAAAAVWGHSALTFGFKCSQAKESCVSSALYCTADECHRLGPNAFSKEQELNKR